MTKLIKGWHFYLDANTRPREQAGTDTAVRHSTNDDRQAPRRHPLELRLPPAYLPVLPFPFPVAGSWLPPLVGHSTNENYRAPDRHPLQGQAPTIRGPYRFPVPFSRGFSVTLSSEKLVRPAEQTPEVVPVVPVTPQEQMHVDLSSISANRRSEFNSDAVYKGVRDSCGAYEPDYGFSIQAFGTERIKELKSVLKDPEKNKQDVQTMRTDNPKIQGYNIQDIPPDLENELPVWSRIFGISRSDEFKKCQSRLKADAAEFLKNVDISKRPGIPSLNDAESHEELVKKALASANGMVIAEAHYSIASKKFAIDNMSMFAKNGVKTLFIEHLCSDLHQGYLDEYSKSPPGSPMPEQLKSYLENQDSGQMIDLFIAPDLRERYDAQKKNYNFTKMVEEAKKEGIRVVAIDCGASYSIYKDGLSSTEDAEKQRLRTMNYLAAKRVQALESHEGAGKWIAFVGNAHANTYQNVPGIAELTGSLSIAVDDGFKPLRLTDEERINPDLRVSIKAVS
jgi:hypothetical protein